MQASGLIVPKQIVFTAVNGVQKLTLENPTPTKFAVKIRTNHKTALHIIPTHDFVQPNSKKDVIVKLLELHNGVKLEINYAIATQEMIAKNDSKLTDVDKRDLKKQITIINVSGVKAVQQTKPKEVHVSKEVHSDELNNSFSSIVPQKPEPSRTIQKKLSLTSSKETSTMVVVEQRLEEDEEEFEQKVKKLQSQLSDLEMKIQGKREKILNKKQRLSAVVDTSSFLPPFTLPIIVVSSFLVGSLIKSFLF